MGRVPAGLDPGVVGINDAQAVDHENVAINFRIEGADRQGPDAGGILGQGFRRRGADDEVDLGRVRCPETKNNAAIRLHLGRNNRKWRRRADGVTAFSRRCLGVGGPNLGAQREYAGQRNYERREAAPELTIFCHGSR